jgi:ComF family protein
VIWLDDILALLFPRLCAACGRSLWKHENIICSFCDFHLPKTYFHLDPDNPLTSTFRGRIQVNGVTALYFFHKGNRVQEMIHQLKYNGRKDVGIFLGMKYGLDLKIASLFNSAEVIIPVPLHPKKKRLRGYNQSEVFGQGLSLSMGIPMDIDSLVRARASDTQTKKSRFSRWQNVSEIFRVIHPERLSGKHLLLVDDVITTGATLEACATELQKLPGVRISLAAIATALR